FYRLACLDAFVQQGIRHSVGKTPLREHLGRLVELAGHPALLDHVGVEVVLGGATARGMEVPEIARCVSETAATQIYTLSLPRALAVTRAQPLTRAVVGS